MMFARYIFLFYINVLYVQAHDLYVARAWISLIFACL